MNLRNKSRVAGTLLNAIRLGHINQGGFHRRKGLTNSEPSELTRGRDGFEVSEGEGVHWISKEK